MRFAALLPVALVLLLPAPAEAAHRCPPRGAKVVRTKGRVHVYKLQHEVYACLGRTGKRYALGDSDVESFVAPIRIDGSLVGFARQDYDHYGYSEATVVVRNLRDGTILHSFHDSGGAYGACDAYSVTDVALAPSGAVAWIADVGSCTASRYEVDAFATGEPHAVLDGDASIEPESLRYAQGSIFWRHRRFGGDSEEHSAPLR
jgi:hypothetical protein